MEPGRTYEAKADESEPGGSGQVNSTLPFDHELGNEVT
jgi:hypothetical protein